MSAPGFTRIRFARDSHRKSSSTTYTRLCWLVRLSGLSLFGCRYAYSHFWYRSSVPRVTSTGLPMPRSSPHATKYPRSCRVCPTVLSVCPFVRRYPL
jgi:hypothetical protein